MAHLLDEDPGRAGDVADALGIARSTLEWHVGRLRRRGLVAKRRDDRGRMALHAVDPERTAALLARARSSLPGSLLYRLGRLVGRLMAG